MMPRTWIKSRTWWILKATWIILASASSAQASISSFIRKNLQTPTKTQSQSRLNWTYAIIAAYHRNKLKWGGWEPPLHDSENRFVEQEEDQCHVLKRVPSNTLIIFDSPFSCLNKYCWSPSRKTFVSDQDIQVITKQTLEMQEKWQSRKVIQSKIQTQQQLHSSPCDCVIGLPLGFTAFNFPLNVANQTQS